MKIIGLTGGIAAGKNFIAEIFAQNGAVIFDADAEVHKLLKLDKSVIAAVRKNFPESFVDKKIERKILGKIVFTNARKLKILEKIIHPQVKKKYQEFLVKVRKQRKEFIVLNIPLLLENKGYKSDYLVAIIAPRKIQKERFLAREKEKHPASTIAELTKKFDQIVRKQISNSERKREADFIINNYGDRARISSAVTKIIEQIKCAEL